MASNIYLSRWHPERVLKDELTYTTPERFPAVLRMLEREHGPVMFDRTNQASSGHFYRFEDGTTLTTSRSY